MEHGLEASVFCNKTNSFNNRGFTLIEVLVAVGIVGILGFVLSSLAYDMARSSGTAQDTQELSSLKYEIDGILNNSSHCTMTLQSQGLSSSDGTVIPMLSGSIRAGEKYGSLNIETMTLKNVMDVSGTGTIYHAIIEITGKKRDSVYGSKEFTIQSGFYYDVSAGAVNQCIGSQTSGTSCSALGGTMIAGKCNFCAAMGGTMIGGVCNLGVTTTTISSCSPAGTILLPAIPGNPFEWCSTGSENVPCTKSCMDGYRATPTCYPTVLDPMVCGIMYSGCWLMTPHKSQCCSGIALLVGGNYVCQ